MEDGAGEGGLGWAVAAVAGSGRAAAGQAAKGWAVQAAAGRVGKAAEGWVAQEVAEQAGAAAAAAAWVGAATASAAGGWGLAGAGSAWGAAAAGAATAEVERQSLTPPHRSRQPHSTKEAGELKLVQRRGAAPWCGGARARLPNTRPAQPQARCTRAKW